MVLAGSSLAADSFDKVNIKRGIVVLLDLAENDPAPMIETLGKSQFTLYFQSADAVQIRAVRTAADKAGLLGNRVFAEHGSLKSIHLAENIADCIIVSPSAVKQTTDQALLRVLRPHASAFAGDREIVKPVPDDIDEWSHPFHGPDNNPQSTDKRVKGEFQTQFLARPRFSPMPEQSVIAGGRVYKAMGHIAHKANQNEMLNTLLCINAYNGTMLWKRPNSPGQRRCGIRLQDDLHPATQALGNALDWSGCENDPGPRKIVSTRHTTARHTTAKPAVKGLKITSYKLRRSPST